MFLRESKSALPDLHAIGFEGFLRVNCFLESFRESMARAQLLRETTQGLGELPATIAFPPKPKDRTKNSTLAQIPFDEAPNDVRGRLHDRTDRGVNLSFDRWQLLEHRNESIIRLFFREFEEYAVRHLHRCTIRNPRPLDSTTQCLAIRIAQYLTVKSQVVQEGNE